MARIDIIQDRDFDVKVWDGPDLNHEILSFYLCGEPVFLSLSSPSYKNPFFDQPLETLCARLTLLKK